MLHAWKKYGEDSAEKVFLEKYDRKYRNFHNPKFKFRQVVKGKLNYIGYIKGKNNRQYEKLCEKLSLLDSDFKVVFNRYKSQQMRLIEDNIWVLECNESSIQGTGFLLEGVGLVTSNHVLGTNTKVFKATDTETKYDIEIVKRDPDIDIAIIKIKYIGSDLKSFKLISTPNIYRGCKVRICGYPNYNPGNSLHVCPGEIIGEQRRFNYVKYNTSANIISGMSGSPVLNDRNQVIGFAITGTDDNNTSKSKEHSIRSVDVVNLLINK